jgi:hypothetical protein
MTREELETALAKIGWSIPKSWNGLNDYIINHKGEKTGFVVRDNQLEVRTNLFGGDTSMGRGTVVFTLEEIDIRLHGDNGNTDCVTIGLGERNYIQFYNHD